MICSSVNAATATTATVTSAIPLTSEPAPAAWPVASAASRRPEAGPPGRCRNSVTASPFAARDPGSDQTLPRIATNPACPLIRAASAAAVKEGGDQGLPVTALMTGRP
jgi:hypothetical protein